MRAPLPPAFLSAPIAHRGYHAAAAHRPENSIAAFSAAIAAGYGIELDLQLTADGEAVVFHDETLDRMTPETGPVLARTAAELARTPLRNSPETIPTLAQTLAHIAGRAPLLIEIKDGLDTMSPTSGLLEAATARALASYSGPVAVMSFNPHCMAAMLRLAPTLPRGLTTDAYDPADWQPLPPETCAHLRDIPDYDATLSSFISHNAADLGRSRVAALKSQGATILCWTIRSEAAEAKARATAHNITFESYPARPVP